MLCNSDVILVSLYVALISIVNLSNGVNAARSKLQKEKPAKVVPSYDVKLYTLKQFEGKMIKLRIEEDTCVNLPSSWEKQVSSVDPTGCIILYADQDCRGFRKRLDRWSFGSSNLKDIAFESKLSSISTCPVIRKPVILDEL